MMKLKIKKARFGIICFSPETFFVNMKHLRKKKRNKETKTANISIAQNLLINRLNF